MAPIKKTPKSPSIQETPAASGRNTPVSDEVPEDNMSTFISSVPIENQEDVRAIIETPNLAIDIQIGYLEEFLTVGQSKKCRKLLEEKCSNFKQYVKKSQLRLVDSMINKEDFESIEKLVIGNKEALAAFKNFLKYNGYDQKKPGAKEDKKGKGRMKTNNSTKDSRKCSKKQQVSSEEEDEEEDEEEEEPEDGEESDESPEEEPAPKPALKNKGQNKKKKEKEEPKESTPDLGYEQWTKHRQNCEARNQPVLSPEDIWELAAKAGAKIAELTARVDANKKEKEQLEKDLVDLEEKRRSEKEALNRLHEQKLQEASVKYLEEMKQLEKRLTEQHARELAATRQYVNNSGQNSANTTINND